MTSVVLVVVNCFDISSYAVVLAKMYCGRAAAMADRSRRAKELKANMILLGFFGIKGFLSPIGHDWNEFRKSWSIR